jgi:hypothetical protein
VKLPLSVLHVRPLTGSVRNLTLKVVEKFRTLSISDFRSNVIRRDCLSDIKAALNNNS